MQLSAMRLLLEAVLAKMPGDGGELGGGQRLPAFQQAIEKRGLAPGATAPPRPRQTADSLAGPSPSRHSGAARHRAGPASARPAGARTGAASGPGACGVQTASGQSTIQRRPADARQSSRLGHHGSSVSRAVSTITLASVAGESRSSRCNSPSSTAAATSREKTARTAYARRQSWTSCSGEFGQASVIRLGLASMTPVCRCNSAKRRARAGCPTSRTIFSTCSAICPVLGTASKSSRAKKCKTTSVNSRVKNALAAPSDSAAAYSDWQMRSASNGT